MLRRLSMLVVPAVVLLAGCAPTSTEDGAVRVVASTSVYGDIAAAVAGEFAQVDSIITGFTQDPHSYQLTARDRLAFEGTDLVVFNGGGYDPFVATVLGAMVTAPPTVEAVAVAGIAAGDHVNEHVWYDLAVVADVAAQIARELGALDPDNAAAYDANATAFQRELETVQTDISALATRATGTPALLTEPVPAYLLAAAGFDDVTPEEFSQAIEEGSDIPPAALASVLAMIDRGAVALVAVNPQTAGPETARVVAAAEDAGVPVVEFLELLPDGTTYPSWMADNVAALSAALG